MRVMITGGAGFIGRNLCAALCTDRRIEAVTVLDDLSAPDPVVMPGVRFVQGSVLDRAALMHAARDADAVVHLAARSSVADGLQDPAGAATVNGLGTALVLEAAYRRDVSSVVIASSAAVYGTGFRAPVSESNLPHPVHPYGATKLAAESYAFAWRHAFGLPTLALRFFNVYGPGQSARSDAAGIVAQFVDAAVNGRPLTIHGDGSQLRDLVYVGDVCRIVKSALLDGVESDEPVNLGTGRATSIIEIAEALQSVLGRPLPRRFEPARWGDVPYSCAAVQRLCDLFPRFEPTPLLDGLAATVAWAQVAARSPAPDNGSAQPAETIFDEPMISGLARGHRK